MATSPTPFTVRELAFQLHVLINTGHGDDPVFKSSDDEGNSFTHIWEVTLTTPEEVEAEDLWIEEPRPYDAPHVVLW